jgi:hypothetical protein
MYETGTFPIAPRIAHLLAAAPRPIVLMINAENAALQIPTVIVYESVPVVNRTGLRGVIAKTVPTSARIPPPAR